MNTEILNHWGGQFLNVAWPMLWQSSLLICLIYILDLALRRKVRASVRHALWLVVLLKLVLPPTLALPTSPSWWIHTSAPPSVTSRAIPFTVTYGNQIPPDFQMPLPPIPTPQRPAMSFAAWALVLSGIVSAGLLAWLLIRWRGVVRKVRDASEAEELDAVLNESARLAGLRSAVRLKLTVDSMSPAVCGLFRPVILLPQSLVEKLSTNQLRAVLLHELIHLRRGDVWVNCAQALLQILYWWHPLLWLANARIRRAREEAVDDAVMLTLRDGADIYAPTLLEVAKFAFRRPLASLGLVGILESRSALRQRIERLINFRAPRKAGLTVVSVLGILAFSAVALPMGEAPEKTNSEAISLQKDDKPTVNTNMPPSTTLDGILSDPQFRVVLHALQQRNGVETLAEPEAVTMAGRGANRMRTDNIQLTTNTPFAGNNASSTNLETRVFKADPNVFFTAVRELTGMNSNDAVKTPDLLKFFSAIGEDFLTAPGRTIAYYDHLGLLFVKATPSELDTIERVIQAVNQTAPQIHIKARFIEVERDNKAPRGFDWYLGNFTNGPVVTNGSSAPSLAVPVSAANPLGSFPGSTTASQIPGAASNQLFKGILSSSNAKVVEHALDSKSRPKILAEPECVTTSGRQTQMRMIDRQTVLAGINPLALKSPGVSSNELFLTEQVECGAVFDVVPYILSDGYTLNLTTTASVTEFLGYDKPTNSVTVYIKGKKQTVVPVPLPKFSTQKISTPFNLFDGQTQVLSGPDTSVVQTTKDKVPLLGDLPVIGRLFRSQSKTEITKKLMVFVTATIVDPAGNRIHTDDEMRQMQEKAKSNVPAQPR